MPDKGQQLYRNLLHHNTLGSPLSKMDRGPPKHLSSLNQDLQRSGVVNPPAPIPLWQLLYIPRALKTGLLTMLDVQMPA